MGAAAVFFGKLALGGLNLAKGIGGLLGRFFRSLNAQGIVGLAGCLVLGLLLILQKGETRHWKKESGRFEQLYNNEHAAFAKTVANYRAAAEKARLADQANVERVRGEQAAISERTDHDYQARIADARARYDRLRIAAQSPAHRGGGGTAPVSAVSAAPGGAAETASQDGFPAQERLADRICGPEGYHDWDQNGPVCEKGGWNGTSYGLDDALTATEQAIQLDELIKWVKAQHGVNVNGSVPPEH